MTIFKNGQSASRIYYSPDGVQTLAPIFIALGEQILWDGRIPAYVTAPRGLAVATGGNNTVSTSAVLDAPTAAPVTADGFSTEVGAGSNILAPSAAGSADGASLDDLNADAAVDVPYGYVQADGGAGNSVDVFQGAFAPSGQVSADGGNTSIQADYADTAAAAAASADGGANSAQADGASNVAAASGSADGGTVGISADANIPAPSATGTAQGHTPALAFSANVGVTAGSGSADGGSPDVKAQTPTYDNSMFVTNTSSPNVSGAITVGEGATVIALVCGGNAGSYTVTCGGTAMTLLGTVVTNSGNNHYMYYIKGVSAGSKTIAANTTTGAYSRSAISAVSYVGVSTVYTGSWAVATGSSNTPTASTITAATTDIVVSGFATTSNYAVSANTGTLRHTDQVLNGGGGYNTMSTVDGTGAASVQNKVSVSNSAAWAVGSVRLG